MKDKVFVVPQNDGEAVAIIDMLKEAGYKEGEDLFITGQSWGASWDGLEPEIKDKLNEYSKKTKTETYRERKVADLSNITLDSQLIWKETYKVTEGGHQGNLGGSSTYTETRQAEGTYRDYLDAKNGHHMTYAPSKRLQPPLLSFYDAVFTGVSDPYTIIEKTVEIPDPDRPEIYGVELQGENSFDAHNIDHHIYENDNRSNSKSSLEQVAELLHLRLSLEQQFIAANDKGYIPAMKDLGQKYEMPEHLINKMIEDTRFLDRQAQGITLEQERQAEEALKNMEVEGDLTTVRLPHSKCATVTDRLYGNYKDMLIICGDGELDFYGKGAICKGLQSEYQGWSGGNLEESGFWGGYADPKQVEDFVKEAERDLAKEAEKTQTATTSIRKK